jgi:hypothetical protein
LSSFHGQGIAPRFDVDAKVAADNIDPPRATAPVFKTARRVSFWVIIRAPPRIIFFQLCGRSVCNQLQPIISKLLIQEVIFLPLKLRLRLCLERLR